MSSLALSQVEPIHVSKLAKKDGMDLLQCNHGRGELSLLM